MPLALESVAFFPGLDRLELGLVAPLLRSESLEGLLHLRLLHLRSQLGVKVRSALLVLDGEVSAASTESNCIIASFLIYRTGCSLGALHRRDRRIPSCPRGPGSAGVGLILLRR